MDSKSDLDCCVAILEFLIDDSDHRNFNNFNDIPKFKRMNEVLGINKTDMIPFTDYINSKYYNNSYNLEDIKGFFRTEKSHNFYKRLIRYLKLEFYIFN